MVARFIKVSALDSKDNNSYVKKRSWLIKKNALHISFCWVIIAADWTNFKLQILLSTKKKDIFVFGWNTELIRHDLIRRRRRGRPW